MKDYQIYYDGKSYYIKDKEDNRVGDYNSIHLKKIKKSIFQIFISFGLILLLGFLVFNFQLFLSKSNNQMILLFFPLSLLLGVKFWMIFSACIDIESDLYEHKNYQFILYNLLKNHPEKNF